MAPDQALEQRGARQPVGAVQAGAGHLAHRVEPLDGAAAVLVHPHAAAGIVRGRHHRQQVARDVEAVLEAAARHPGELGADALGGDVGAQVEVHVRHAALEDLGVDAARHHVARRKVLPLRVVAIHERRAVLVHEPRARAADRLGDQEARRVAVVEGRRVELHVLGVDHPGAGAIRHRESVAARAHGVGGAQVDLAEPAGGQDGGAGEAADDLARGLLEHVGAHAGQRVVDGAAVAAVVGRGEQVHRGVRGEEAHARVRGRARRSTHPRWPGPWRRWRAGCAAASARPRGRARVGRRARGRRARPAGRAGWTARGRARSPRAVRPPARGTGRHRRG